MAKRRKRRVREKAVTIDYLDADGNTLSLRETLSKGTFRKLAEGPATAWYLELGGDTTFCEKLSLEVAPGGTAGLKVD